MAKASRHRAPLAACVFLICASAAATVVVVYTAFPASLNPCTYSLPRALIAVTGLDPYIVSCAGDVDTAPLSDGSNGDKKIGGPLVTSLLTCVKATLPPDPLPPFYCCPPAPASEPINFTLPDPAEPLRVRRPMHAVGAEHMAKYERAVALMRALPHDDPRSLYQLANVHCAYCTGSYRQTGDPELNMQIHFSWLFFPFHHAYLYFFERIAARLLGEPGFALPFWGWDVPEGMRMAPEFTNSSSPLHDAVRNPAHAPPTVVDLDFAHVENNLTDEQQIQQNLRIMYKQMTGNAALPSLLHGQPFRAGQSDRPGPGTVKLTPHNTMHLDRRSDPPQRGGHGHLLLRRPRPALLPAPQQRRPPVGGVARRRRRPRLPRPRRLHGPRLARLLLPLLRRGGPPRANNSPRCAQHRHAQVQVRRRRHAVGRRTSTSHPKREQKSPLKSVRFPLSLDAAVAVEVTRPRVLRSRREKAVREEVLVVEGIETDGTEMVKFDVYVNAMEYDQGRAERAGVGREC